MPHLSLDLSKSCMLPVPLLELQVAACDYVQVKPLEDETPCGTETIPAEVMLDQPASSSPMADC